MLLFPLSIIRKYSSPFFISHTVLSKYSPHFSGFHTLLLASIISSAHQAFMSCAIEYIAYPLKSLLDSVSTSSPTSYHGSSFSSLIFING